jgi:hypothetical protein
MQSYKNDKIYVLSSIINDQQKKFSKSDDEVFARKPSPGQWSKKEILGHLIDSALNNIQRFIRVQYEEKPSISYDQDQWVALNGYQQSSLHSLMELWVLLNERIIVILRGIPEEILKRIVVIKGVEYTLEWLIGDYIRHMEHHLEQINSTSSGL